MTDDINDVSHTSTLGKFEEAVRRSHEAAARAPMVRLEARPADDSQEWTEIFPAQLEWVAKQGHQVRAIECAVAARAQERCHVCGWNGGGARDEGCLLPKYKCPRHPAQGSAEQLAELQYEAGMYQSLYENAVERCATMALEQRCERGTPWDLACTTIAEKIRGLAIPSTHCQCPSCRQDGPHDSSCAVHSEPYQGWGPCNCSLSLPT